MKNINDLKARAKELANNIPFMVGREKGDFSRLKGREVTIIDYGFMNDQKGEYLCFIIKEDGDFFYFGGTVITDQVRILDIDGFGETIRKIGLPVMFGEALSKNNRNYATVEFYPESK